MEPRVNHALVGLFIVALSAVLVAVGIWLSTGLSQGDSRRYSIYMGESAYGLGPDSSVVYYGVGVGRVVDVNLAWRGENNVHAVIEVDSETVLRQGTIASLSVRGVTGIPYIELTGGSESAPPLEALPGEPYPVIPYRSSLITRLDQEISDGMDTLEQIGRRISDVLSPENVRRIESILANVDNLTAELTTASRQLRTTLREVDNTAVAGGQAAAQITQTFQRARQTLVEIERMAQSVNEAGRDVSALGEGGQTVISELRSTTLPRLRALSVELEGAARSLRDFAESLERDPAQLLRGKAPVSPGPGEHKEAAQ